MTPSPFGWHLSAWPAHIIWVLPTNLPSALIAGMTVNCLLSPQPSTEICFAPDGPQVRFCEGKRHKPVSSMLISREGGMLCLLTMKTILLRNILFTSPNSSGKLLAALVMVLNFSPIFSKNFLYHDLEGTHDILCTSKNPSTVPSALQAWLTVGTQHYTGQLSYLPKNTVNCMELWCCWFLIAVSPHMGDWALGHASSQWHE